MSLTTTTTPPARITVDATTHPDEPSPRFGAPAMTVTEFGPEWNGRPCPAVTAATFRQWVTDMAAHDPAGPWNPAGIREAWMNGNGDVVDTMPDDEDLAAWPVLVYDNGVTDPDVWRAAQADAPNDVLPIPLADDDFDTLYPLDGWLWSTQPV